MSQVETNPLINDTILTRNPNQVIETLPAVQIHDFSTYNPFNRHISSFNIPQTDWVSIAATEKYFGEFDWSTATDGDLKIIEFSFKELKKLIPIGLDVNSYVNLDTILINIKKTDNAFYQGALIIAFDPAPTASFYSKFHKTTIALEHIWQFPKVMLNPKTAGDIVLSIPINFPFEFFKNGSDQLGLFHQDYSFGRLRIFVMDKLATMSPTQSLSYPIQAQLINFSTSGLKFDSPA
jgi:hypothetical protein